MSPEPDLDVAADAAALAARAARWIAQEIAAAPGRFALSLSGGTTPREVYARLAAEPLRGAIDWSRVEIFWGDERFVPKTDERSNFRMASEALLSRVPIPAAQIHAVPVEAASPQDAAALYDATLRRHYGAASLDAARPLFSLTLLGLGTDGHTASLFPATPALDVADRLAVAVVGAMPEPRVTLTYPALGSSATIAFLVSGASKRDMLRRALAGDPALPAARVKTAGAIRIFADAAAFPG